jgi:RNA polymerase sigma factor (sigma-70 family)
MYPIPPAEARQPGIIRRVVMLSDSDEALIERYADGDVTAFERLYRRHELAVWRYLQRNVRDQAIADELLQEVWFAVARDAARYSPSSRFTSWLFTIAHHRMIDFVRSRRINTSLDVLLEGGAAVTSFVADPSSGPLARAAAQDDIEAITRALGLLPADQREAFLLQAEGGLSVEEIAAATAASFETTKSRLRYAKNKLRELLKEYA